MKKQAHLRTISVFGFLAIIILFAIYFPLTFSTLFLISAFVATYIAIYQIFKQQQEQ
jgi:hypothetical protein